MIFQTIFNKNEVDYLEQHLSGAIVSIEPHSNTTVVVSLQIKYASDIHALFFAGYMSGIDNYCLNLKTVMYDSKNEGRTQRP